MAWMSGRRSLACTPIAIISCALFSSPENSKGVDTANFCRSEMVWFATAALPVIAVKPMVARVLRSSKASPAAMIPAIGVVRASVSCWPMRPAVSATWFIFASTPESALAARAHPDATDEAKPAHADEAFPAPAAAPSPSFTNRPNSSRARLIPASKFAVSAVTTAFSCAIVDMIIVRLLT